MRRIVAVYHAGGEPEGLGKQMSDLQKHRSGPPFLLELTEAEASELLSMCLYSVVAENEHGQSALRKLAVSLVAPPRQEPEQKAA
ncbi:MAG: hypothetical protein IH851_13340 [Armatimonadetes bacterium]|nr:hypothetical protein [Armatimonadota bacterium]